MDWNEINTEPTVADEVSPQVDDGEVISKTLPASRRTYRDRFAAVQDSLDPVRRFVAREPMQALLVAAATGAVLTALLVAAAPPRSRIASSPQRGCGRL